MARMCSSNELKCWRAVLLPKEAARLISKGLYGLSGVQ